jgi:hypothetical protein
MTKPAKTNGKKRRRSVNPNCEMASRKRAWEAFSKFIRLRDAMATTQTTKFCRCITCGSIHPVEGKRSIQAGHLMPGRHDSVLFDERGVHGQCYRCNVERSGVWPAYYRKMIEMYGPGIIDEMFAKWDDHATNYSPAEYQAIQRKYEGRLAMLKLGVKR